MTRLTRLTAGALCLSAALWTASAGATEIYVYVDADGSRLITDHPRIEPGFQLVRVYSESKIYRQVGAAPRAPRIKPLPSAYDHVIANAANRAGVDPLLVKSVMHAESAFNPNAVSRKGASGLMQLMPGTAKRYGVSQIFDPHENILGGARYLSDLLDLFNGDLKLALAGYNAGENAVLERGGVPPFRETERYISKVLRLYRAYQSDRCEQHRNKVAGSDSTIISCSSSTTRAPSNDDNKTSSVSKASESEQPASVGVASVSAGTVSSAGQTGWRVVE
jgi:hypothetical protein